MKASKALCAVAFSTALAASGLPSAWASAEQSASPVMSDEYVDIVVQLESRDADVFGFFSKLIQSDEARHQSVQNKIEDMAEEVSADEDSAEDVEVKYDYYNSVDGFIIHAPASVLKDIKQLGGVKGAYVARTFEVPQDEGSSSSELGNKDALDMTGANQVEQSGAGQTICVIDSGLEYTHEAFSGELDSSKLGVTKEQMELKKQDLVQGGREASYVSDKIPFAYDYADDDDDVNPYLLSSNHGTHVTGIAAANAGEVRGTAPDAQIYAMKVSRDANGGIPEGAILAAFDDAAVLEPNVVTMSIGANCGFSDDEASVYSDVISTLEDKGCFVSISAGNASYATSGTRGHNPFSSSPDYGTISTPSTSVSALSVASVDVTEDDSAAHTSSFSSWGATPELKLKPEVAAPGGDVYSTITKGQYGYKSGTSMATPHIAGISAMVKERIASDSRFDALSDSEKADVVTQLVMSTAVPVTDEGSEVYSSPRKQGSGLVNAKAALSSEVFAQVIGAENDSRPKAELGSSAEGAWDFEIQLRNLGAEAHAFKVDVSALSEQIENGRFNQNMKNYADAGIAVSCAGANYDAASGILTVPANANASLQVSIACQDTFKTAVAEAVSGTYVEGFVRLFAVDNGVDLSVPYMGYYGDWGAASVFDATIESGEAAQTNLSKLVAVGDEAASASHITLVSDSTGSDAVTALVPRTFLLRNAVELRYSYKNEEDEVVRSYEYSYVSKAQLDSSGQWEWAEQFLPYEPVFDGYDDSGRKLGEGTYTLEVTAKTAGPDSREQMITQTFAYDTSGATVTEDDFERDSTGKVLVGYKGTSAHVVIPSGITEIGESAFEGSKIKGVVIPSSVTKIGKRAFANTESLASVNIRARNGMYNLQTIGEEAFSETGLARITVPEGVTSLGDRVFASSSLIAAVLPGSLEEVPEGAFSDSWLEQVTLTDGIAHVNSNAFENCIDLEEVTLPSSVRSIAASAFAGSGLESVSLNNGLESIGTAAFEKTALTSLAVPDSVIELGSGAFSGMNKVTNITIGTRIPVAQLEGAFVGSRELREIAVAGSASDYRVSNRALVTSDGKKLIAFPNGLGGTYKLGDGIEIVSHHAFAGSSLASVTFPDSLRELGAHAFDGSKVAGAIQLPASMNAVGESAFEGAGVSSVDLGGTVSVGAGAFASCKNLTQVDFRGDLNRLVTIGERAFNPETPLSSVILPDSVVEVGLGAFSNNQSLTSVRLGAKVTSKYDELFSGCGNIATIEVAAENKNYYADNNVLYERADEGLKVIFSPETNGLVDYVVAEGTVSIERRAFRNNTTLTRIVFPEGLKSIGSGAFTGCSNLEEAVFPDSLETVNGFANTNLTRAEFGSNITEINGSAFTGHNPSTLVVQGGKATQETKGGTYKVSSQGGRVKSAAFGPGMVEIDFSRSGTMAPPEQLVISGDVTKLTFDKPSSSNNYDPASVTIYAPRGTSAWLQAETALRNIGADPGTQLKDYIVLSVKSAKLVLNTADASEATVRVQGAGGISSGYEFRFVKDSVGGEVLQSWSSEATFAWKPAVSTEKLRCEVRDAGGLVAVKELTLADASDGDDEGDDDPVVPVPTPDPADNQKPGDSGSDDKTKTDATNKKTGAVTVDAKTVSRKAVTAAAKKAGIAADKVEEVVLGNKAKTVKAGAFKAFPKLKIVTLGKNVKTVKKNAFKGSKVTKVIVKTKKLSAKSVKGSLKGSKVKTIQVKVGSSKANKKTVKKYKKIFTKKNAGKKAKVRR